MKMIFSRLLASISLAQFCAGTAITKVLTREVDFAVPSFSGLSGNEDDTNHSQVFTKTLTFKLLSKDFPTWPVASQTVQVAVEYQYSEGFLAGVPLGTVVASGKLAKTSANAAQLMTAVSWSDEKTSGTQISGTLNLQFRLTDASGKPTFSFEIDWQDVFIAGKVGAGWQEKIADVKRVAAQCEEGFCTPDKVVILEKQDFTLSVA